MMKKIMLMGIVFAMATLSGCNYFGPCVDGSGPVISELREVGVFTGVTNTASFDLFVSHADDFSVEVRAQENLFPIIETYVSGNKLIVQTENGSCYRSSSPVEVHVSMPETEFLSLAGSGKVYADMLISSDVEISNSGSGRMEIDSLRAESLVLSNGGSGNIAVEASSADDVEAIQSGSGEIMCGTLHGASDVSIRQSSSGRVSALVPDGVMMDVVLSGSGRIDLTGDVEVAEYSLSSSGRIDALDLMALEVEATNTGSGDIYLWANEFLDATVTGSGDIIYRGNPVLSIRITGSGNIRSY
jgi:uncharacterized protein (AIM24 family)